MFDGHDYLEAPVEGEERWKGWFISDDSSATVRLSLSPMDTCNGKIPIDYRSFSISDGSPIASGILCVHGWESIRDLKCKVAKEVGKKFALRICGLGGFHDMMDRAFLRRSVNDMKATKTVLFNSYRGA
ncbi:MAG: hypothetical protein E7Z63_00980 [Thermoplasmata archaeon]|nr:hypothetical protein [Thermoplasmata archaeon]